MKFRITMKQLDEWSDRRLLKALVVERRSDLNPYSPLAERLAKLETSLSENKTDDAYDFMRTTAPRDWESRIEAMPFEKRNELAVELLGIAERAAQVAGYVEGRLSRDHRGGVRRSNKFCTAIRRAIGFSYPKSELSF